MPDGHGIEIDHETGAAQQEEPGERGDKRLDLAEIDDEALKPAEKNAEGEHRRGGCEWMPADCIEIGDDDADKADHRSDREIDAAGENDEGRPDRRGNDEGVVG